MKICEIKLIKFGARGKSSSKVVRGSHKDIELNAGNTIRRAHLDVRRADEGWLLLEDGLHHLGGRVGCGYGFGYGLGYGR